MVSVHSCEYQAVAAGSHIYSSLVEIFISDFIVIWRAWVLFQDRQWVVLIPVMLWIGAVGESIDIFRDAVFFC